MGLLYPNDYHYYGNERLKKCEKPDCFRLTTALYCCGACDYADQKKFELEEGKEPPLGHSDFCNRRHSDRIARGAIYQASKPK